MDILTTLDDDSSNDSVIEGRFEVENDDQCHKKEVACNSKIL